MRAARRWLDSGGLDSHVRPRHSPHLAPGPPESNRNTELLEGVRSPSPVDLRQAYQFARAVSATQPAGPLGHRLVWVRGAAFASVMLEPARSGFAVVGRHTRCGVVLPDDPFVALRHLLVRSIQLPGGRVALRVFDLHTDLGFTLTDGSRQKSVFAEGPVAIGVGEYALVALPNDAQSKPSDLPNELPPPVVETPAAVREQLDALAAAMSPYRMNARPARKSIITLMPRLVMVGEALPPSLGRLAGGGYVLALSRAGRTAGVTLSDEDLARGVIIGRSEKCHSEELRRITDVNTSRVHVLLIKEEQVVQAYDLASTQGTYAFGGTIGRLALPDGGVVLQLGQGGDAVQLTWRRRG